MLRLAAPFRRQTRPATTRAALPQNLKNANSAADLGCKGVF